MLMIVYHTKVIGVEDHANYTLALIVATFTAAPTHV